MTRKKTTRKVTAAADRGIRIVEEFRDRLNREMTRQKITMRGLSARADMGPTAISHLLRAAGDVNLTTADKISTALNVPLSWMLTGQVGIYESDDPKNFRIKLLPVGTADDPNKSEVDETGYVVATGAQAADDSRALLIRDSAMRVEGINTPVDPHSVVLPGDIVVWSASTAPSIGELVVAKSQFGAIVRRLTQNDSGELRLVANNAAFPQVGAKKSDLLGGVLGVWRVRSRRDLGGF